MLAAVAWIAVGVLLLTPFWGCCCASGSPANCAVRIGVGGCGGLAVPAGTTVVMTQGGVTVASAATNSSGLAAATIPSATTVFAVSSPPARLTTGSTTKTAAQLNCGGTITSGGVLLAPASGYACYCGQLDYNPAATTLFLTDSFYGVTVTMTYSPANDWWTGSASVGIPPCGTGLGSCSGGSVTVDYLFWQNPGGTFTAPFCQVTAVPRSNSVGGCSVAGAGAAMTATSPAPGLTITGTSGASSLYPSTTAGSCVANTSTYTITE